MKTVIAILSSPRHVKWRELTEASINVFWKNHPKIIVFSENDHRDWLTTAIDMADFLKKEGYDIAHWLLSDHAILDFVRHQYIIGAECCIGSEDGQFDAVSYRSLNEQKGITGTVVPSFNHNFCLCSGAWLIEALVKNLKALGDILIGEQRTPAYVDRLFHSGLLPRTGAMTGYHNALPMPVHGALFQGQIDNGYLKCYEKYPQLLNKFKIAAYYWNNPFFPEVDDTDDPKSLVNLMMPEGSYTRCRYGKNADGGYVLIDSENMEVNVLYSYGVGNDVSFELDFTKKHNVLARLFDPTIDRLPEGENENMLFTKKGICTSQGTFKTHVLSNFDEGKLILLKMDVEGAEWQFFRSEFDDFFITSVPMFVVEFHHALFVGGTLTRLCSDEDTYNIFKDIQKYYYPVHIHNNNAGTLITVLWKDIWSLQEITFVRKDICKCVENNIIFPIEGLDFSNI